MPTGKNRVVIDAERTVRVHVSPATMFNFEQSSALLKTVLGRLGCQGCTSGFNIIFQLEEGEFTVG